MHIISQLIRRLQHHGIKLFRLDVILTDPETVLGDHITGKRTERRSDVQYFAGRLVASEYGDEQGDLVLD